MSRGYAAFFLRELPGARPFFGVTTLNGARMPSIAEELATDFKTILWRRMGSLRKRLVVFINLAIFEYSKRKSI